MGRQSVTKTRQQIGRQAGQDDLLGRSTILELVHRQGEQLVATQRQRAEATLAENSDDQRAQLEPASLQNSATRTMTSPSAARGCRARARRVGADGLLGGGPAFPVTPGEPPQVEPSFVIVEPHEVKTKVQPHTGSQEVWTLTAVVLVAGCNHLLAEVSPAGSRRRVGALLAELEMPGQAMILCWWHLCKRCLKRAVLGRLWRGRVDEAIAPLMEASAWVNRPAAVATLMGYLKKRHALLPA